MIKLLFFLMGVALTLSGPPTSGDTHFLTTNTTDQDKYAHLDAEEEKLEECDICKKLLPHLVKQLPKAEGSEDHFSSVIDAACKELQVPSGNCTEFVKSFPTKVMPIKD